ncbi:MAG: TonB-dependent receptor [Sphingomonas sp.]|nr:TonB-dependent receptor [Sphingomonas sp.]
MLNPRARAVVAVRALLLGGACFTALAATGAQAQTKPQETPSLPKTTPTGDTTTIETAAGDEVVVSGTRPIRESQDAALRVQKNSDSLVSVLSADSVGRLPDQNIAQAAGRLPGVAVQRDQGQARYISIRGAPLNWTTLAFDGINIISPEGRDARFDSIPSAIAAQIIVKKAVTPDLTAETIAGQVNVVTRSALDYRDVHAAFRLGGGYGDLGGGTEFEGTAVLSKRWNTGIGDIGVLVSGTWYQRKMATDNFETDWESVDQDRRPLGAGEVGPRIWARETENKLYRLMRRNYSGTIRLDWRPNDQNRLFAYSVYSAFTDNELRWNGIYDFDDQQGRVPQLTTACPATPVLAPNTTGYADVCAGNTPLLGTVYGIDINYNALSREFLQSVQTNTIGGDHEVGKWEFNWRVNYTQSVDDRSAPAQINYESPGFGTNGATATQRPTVFYDLRNPSDARVELYRTLRAADGTLSRGARVQQFEDFAIPLSRIRSLRAADVTDAYTGRIVASRRTELFGDTKFTAGFQFDTRTKTVHEFLLDVNPATLVPGSTQTVFARSGVPTTLDAITIPQPYLGQLPLGFNFRYFSKDAIQGLVNAVSPFAQPVFAQGNFFKVNEQVTSGWAMGVTTLDWGNIVYGLRVENVRNTSQAFSQNPALRPGQPANALPQVLQTVQRDFLGVFPSLHVNWNITDEHKLRFSFNTGAARPDYPVLRPNFTFNDANLTISGGNPDARPERARGVDVYWEYYPKFGGFFSLGAFYKDVSNVLFGSTRTFGSDVLNTQGVDRSQYVFSTIVNGGSGYIYGAEATAQFQVDDFDKSDSWLGGFGIQMNATLNRSSARTSNGADARTVRLPGTSDYVLNIGPYYEKYGFSIRAQYQYRSDWLDGLGDLNLATGATTTGGDFYWAADDELDVSARYAITPNFEVYADASNLLNGEGRRYAGVSQRTIEFERFGRRFVAGVRITFN